eukprot:7613853-Alexandrium_andersonii.AAC.1
MYCIRSPGPLPRDYSCELAHIIMYWESGMWMSGSQRGAFLHRVSGRKRGCKVALVIESWSRELAQA